MRSSSNPIIQYFGIDRRGLPRPLIRATGQTAGHSSGPGLIILTIVAASLGDAIDLFQMPVTKLRQAFSLSTLRRIDLVVKLRPVSYQQNPAISLHGTNAKCQAHHAMSEFEGRAENICSV